MTKPHITKIYLDIDGVLTDWEIRKFPTGEEWKKWFDDFITYEGFLYVAKHATADLLTNFLDWSGVPIEILSSAGGTPLYDQIREQKVRWLLDHDIFYPVNVVPGKWHKKDFAHPNALLIDDQQVNCTDFIKAGGHAICHDGVSWRTIEQLRNDYTLVADRSHVWRSPR